MIKTILLSMMVLLSVILLPTISVLYRGNAFYLSSINFIYCRNSWECNHEVAHYMDQELNEISKSVDFGQVVGTYLYCQFTFLEPNELTDLILQSMIYSKSYEAFHSEAFSSPQEELYANIYASVDGDVSKLPTILQRFYSKSPKYDSIYNYAMTNKYYIPKGELVWILVKFLRVFHLLVFWFSLACFFSVVLKREKNALVGYYLTQ